jgi:hypothetical protein
VADTAAIAAGVRWTLGVELNTILLILFLVYMFGIIHQFTNTAGERSRTAMSFAIYVIGFLIVIGGLFWAAVLLHVAAHWIAVGAIVMLGLALLKGVQATRGKDPS